MAWTHSIHSQPVTHHSEASPPLLLLLVAMSSDAVDAGASLAAALASIAAPAASADALPSSAPNPGRTGAVGKGELRQAILGAILAERARKQARKAAGLPDTESSSDDDSDEDDAPPRRPAQSRAAAAAAPRPSAPSDATANKTDYGVAQYWDSRYTKTKGLFDWYVEYEQLQPLLDEFGRRAFDAIGRVASSASASAAAQAAAPLPTPAVAADATSESSAADHTAAASPSPSFPRSSLPLLDVGCGNSGLGAELYKHGWTDLTHIDISSVVIERMREQYRSAPDSYGRWLTMDATRMTFPDGCFALAIEKGTIDALDCTPEEQQVCQAILRECARVLRPGGVLLVVTHGSPRRRLPMLQRGEFGWKVETRAIAYSTSALFIRLLRAQLHGLPLSHATPTLMAQCAARVRSAKAQIQAELERAQTCIARVEAEFAAAAAAEQEGRPAASSAEEDSAAMQAEAAAFSPATSNICFVYACTKNVNAASKDADT